jgi:enterobacterial common antigen flippase
VKLPKSDTATRFSWPIAKRLLTLGGFMVVIGLMLNVVNFWVRKILITDLGEAAAGMFQSATALSLLFANYILGAMGTDFLPRISSAAHDHEEMNRMVNEQTSVAMLLGLPGVIATILLAPVVIPLFYSSEFSAAVPVLQLLSIGVFGRLLAWPLGFALIAKNAVAWCLISEVITHIINLGMLAALIPYCGVTAAGYASVAVYVIYPIAAYWGLRERTGLRWSAQVWQVLAIGVALILSTLFLEWWAPSPAKWIIGGISIAVAGGYSISRLSSGAGVTSGGIVRKIVAWRKGPTTAA